MWRCKAPRTDQADRTDQISLIGLISQIEFNCKYAMLVSAVH